MSWSAAERQAWIDRIVADETNQLTSRQRDAIRLLQADKTLYSPPRVRQASVDRNDPPADSEGSPAD